MLTLGEHLRGAPAFYLNLDRRTDRDARTRALLADWSGPVIRVAGVDEAAVSTADAARFAPSLSPAARRFAAAKLGCVRGHQAAARAWLDRDRFPLLFIQDDIAFAPDWLSVAAPDEPSDLLALAGRSAFRSVQRALLARPGWHPITHQWLTIGVIVVQTADAARSLLADWNREFGAADHAWRVTIATKRVFARVPPLAWQIADYSDLTKSHRPAGR